MSSLGLLESIDTQLEVDEHQKEAWTATFYGSPTKDSQLGTWNFCLLAKNGFWTVVTNPFPSSLDDRIAAIAIVKRAWAKRIAEEILSP